MYGRTTLVSSGTQHVDRPTRAPKQGADFHFSSGL
jgi:hypothetical protein